MVRTNKNQEQNVSNQDKAYYCIMQLSQKCKNKQGMLTSTDFYAASNNTIFSNGKVHICKDCMKEYVYNSENDIDILKFKKILMLIDYPFYQTDFDSAIKDKKETIGMYLKNVQLNHKGATWSDGDIDKLDILQIESQKISEEDIEFWGKGFTEEEYMFLNNEYDTLCSRYECDSYSLEVLFQEIACQRLDIKKKRQSGISVDKELKTLQDLLGSANIKPVQETGANATEQATFGTLLKKWENEKPVPEPLEEWEKNDWIKKYVLVWFLGHLCKMMGVKNQFSDMYDAEMKEFTVEMDEEDNSENDNVVHDEEEGE